MKVFEKWKKEYCSRHCCSGTGSCDDCNTLHKEGYRAALEWLQNNADCAGECDLAPCEFKIIIREELEEEAN